VPFPYCGANCKNPTALAQGDDPKMPPWDSWDPDTLPSCHHWRNAHEVPYPWVGANCVNRNGAPALAQKQDLPTRIPWEP